MLPSLSVAAADALAHSVAYPPSEGWLSLKVYYYCNLDLVDLVATHSGQGRKGCNTGCQQRWHVNNNCGILRESTTSSRLNTTFGQGHARQYRCVLLAIRFRWALGCLDIPYLGWRPFIVRWEATGCCWCCINEAEEVPVVTSTVSVPCLPPPPPLATWRSSTNLPSCSHQPVNCAVNSKFTH